MLPILFLCFPLVGIITGIIAARIGRDPLIYGLGGVVMPIVVVPLLLRMAWERCDIAPFDTDDAVAATDAQPATNSAVLIGGTGD